MSNETFLVTSEMQSHKCKCACIYTCIHKTAICRYAFIKMQFAAKDLYFLI